MRSMIGRPFLNRRSFLRDASTGLGGIALAALLASRVFSALKIARRSAQSSVPKLQSPHDRRICSPERSAC